MLRWMELHIYSAHSKMKVFLNNLSGEMYSQKYITKLSHIFTNHDLIFFLAIFFIADSFTDESNCMDKIALFTLTHCTRSPVTPWLTLIRKNTPKRYSKL
jgi:hypothetical protein